MANNKPVPKYDCQRNHPYPGCGCFTCEQAKLMGQMQDKHFRKIPKSHSQRTAEAAHKARVDLWGFTEEKVDPQSIFSPFRGRRASRVDKRHRIGVEEWFDSGRWVRVKSSNVVGIRYDKIDQVLYVEFGVQKGFTYGMAGTYAYSNVPDLTAKNMFVAPSMGKFVWQHLRDKYPYRKVN